MIKVVVEKELVEKDRIKRGRKEYKREWQRERQREKGKEREDRKEKSGTIKKERRIERKKEKRLKKRKEKEGDVYWVGEHGIKIHYNIIQSVLVIINCSPEGICPKIENFDKKVKLYGKDFL